MASTFLTRLRVGPILVDAKGLSRLYHGRVKGRDLGMLVGAALVVMTMVVMLSDVFRLELQLMWTQLVNTWESVF